MNPTCSCGWWTKAVKKWIGILDYIWVCAKCGDEVKLS